MRCIYLTPYGADLTANDGGVHAWDEGWAFYAGSLEGTTAAGSADGGQMLFALAEKRCENFGTCTGDSNGDDFTGISAVNTDLLALWEKGLGHLQAQECTAAAAVIEDIVALMAVPLVQGVLRCVSCVMVLGSNVSVALATYHGGQVCDDGRVDEGSAEVVRPCTRW